MMISDYDNIIETLEVIAKKKGSKDYLQVINTICNLLNEEETGRFNTAEYIRVFSSGRLIVNVRYKSTHKVNR